MSANLDVVTQAYEAFKRHDAEALVELADPEVEFANSAAARDSVYRGHTGIRRYMNEIEGVFGHAWDAEIERIAEAGDDRVVFVARVFGEGKAGEPIELHVAHVWELRNGKLLHGTVYLDPEAALAAVEEAATP